MAGFFAGHSVNLASRRNPVVLDVANRYSDHIETPHVKENTMNIVKHMEAAFVVALGLAGSATYLIDALPEAQAHPQTAATIATPANMAVVTVSAKRMSAAEKQQSLEAERAADRSRI
jgi:hypothetical protein